MSFNDVIGLIISHRGICWVIQTLEAWSSAVPLGISELAWVESDWFINLEDDLSLWCYYQLIILEIHSYKVYISLFNRREHKWRRFLALLVTGIEAWPKRLALDDSPVRVLHPFKLVNLPVIFIEDTLPLSGTFGCSANIHRAGVWLLIIYVDFFNPMMMMLGFIDPLKMWGSLTDHWLVKMLSLILFHHWSRECVLIRTVVQFVPFPSLGNWVVQRKVNLGVVYRWNALS